MNELRRKVPYRHGETPSSFLGRLAARNGVDSWRFSLEFRMPFRDLAGGEPDSLRRLAALSGAPHDELALGAFRRLDGGWWWGQERVSPSIMRRMDVHVCPHCLREDVADDGGSGLRSAWQRSEWCVCPILSCSRHGTRLVSIGSGATRERTHDFSHHARAVLSRLEDYERLAGPRRASKLQEYLLARRRGERNVPWLDGLPFHVAAETVGLFGRASLFGRHVQRDELSVEDRHAADDAGFDVVRDGEEGIAALLDHLLVTFERPASNNARLRAVFGSVFATLDGASGADGFETVRHVVGRHLIGHLPLPAGDYLGVPLERRRLHTVTSAAIEAGIDRKALRDLLVERGVIDRAEGAAACNSIVFDALGNSGLLECVRTRLTSDQAALRMGLHVAQFRLWVEAGIVKPFAPARDGSRGRDWFAPSDVDEVLARLMGQAKPCGAMPDGCEGLASIGRVCFTDAATVVTMILEGRLGAVWRLRGVTGCASIAVDRAEVARLLENRLPSGLSMEDVRDRLRISIKDVQCLRDDGVLSTMPDTSFHAGPKRVRYDGAEVEAFAREHVTLRALSREVGKDARVLRRELEAVGVKAAYAPEPYTSRIYRRKDLDRLPAIGAGGTGQAEVALQRERLHA